MIIRKIELENFRQFYGVQSIDFGKNAENKNVTVIIGGNGSGKTTINQAFIFCLFGPNEINLPDFNNRNHDNLNEILKLCNNNKLKEKENFQMGVKLEFEHNNRVYNIHRFYRFIWRHNNSKFEFRDINQFNGQVIELNGHAGTQEFHQYDVSKIMPKSLHNLFFFDGERMNQLAKKDASNVISNHVIDILGLRVFRKTLRILKRNDHAANEINTTKTVEFILRKELKTPNKDTQELVENISSLEEEIEELKQKKNSLIERINELEHESKLKLDLIKTHSADKSKQERRESLIEANRGLDAQKQRKRQDIINLFSKKFVNVLCLEHSELIKNTIAHSITEDRDIIGINSSAIDSLLEKRKCLCGEPLEKGSEKYEIVSEWKKYLPPQDLSNLLFTLRTDMNDAVNEAEEFLNQFHVFMGDLVDLQDKISKNERELNDIKQDNLMVEKLKKLEHEYENIKNEQVKQKINLSQTEDKIENLNSDLKKLKLELEDLTQGIKENEIVYKKMSLLENVYKIIENNSIKREKTAQEMLQKEASENYDKMLKKDFSIKLNSNYTYDVYDNEGNLKTPSLSEGERIVTSFAFVGALIKSAKKLNKLLQANDTTEYPLVMDAPFAKVDKEHRTNVATLIPSFSSQIIIFSIDSQWEGAIEEALKNKISKIIYINYDEKTNSSYIENMHRRKAS